MTDRINAVVVVLDHDVRIDDAENGILNAIRHLKGVIDVQPHVAQIEDMIAHSRVRRELMDKLWQVLHDE